MEFPSYSCFVTCVCGCQIFFVSRCNNTLIKELNIHVFWCKLLLYCFTQSRAVIGGRLQSEKLSLGLLTSVI